MNNIRKSVREFFPEDNLETIDRMTNFAEGMMKLISKPLGYQEIGKKLVNVEPIDNSNHGTVYYLKHRDK